MTRPLGTCARPPPKPTVDSTRQPRTCVYLLQSLSHPDQWYVGLTSDLDERLAAHNSGRVPHTSQYTPWEVVVSVHFRDEHAARAFEQYLKSGSGRAFAQRHFRASV